MTCTIRAGSNSRVRKALLVFLLILSAQPSKEQSLSAEATVNNYSLALKRLLMVSTQQFINYLAPGQDQDSILSITCRTTRQPFLLFFNQRFESSPSVGGDLINAGKPQEAIRLLASLQGKGRIQLLVELAIWYLHQTGVRKTDLDSCESYISLAAALSKKGGYAGWQTECDFVLAELYAQRGDTTKARQLYTQMMSGFAPQDPEDAARVYQCLGKLLPNVDTVKLTCFKSALERYHTLQKHERELELQGDMVGYYFATSRDLKYDYLLQIESLQRSIGFRHTLFIQNFLSYIFLRRSDNIKAMEYANAALENMKWAGLDAMAGSMYFRIATIYGALGKNEDAISIFKTALVSRSLDTQIFWYKNLILVPELLFIVNRPKEALSLLTAIADEYPPRTTWEQMQVLETKGRCYEMLGSHAMADKYYMELFSMAEKYPLADVNGELTGDYIMVALYYVSQKNFDRARLFLKQSLKFSKHDAPTTAYRYLLLFKLDSANNNYASALRNYMQYKLWNDSSNDLDQRKKFDELTIKYAAEKKDQDIKLLRQQALLQQSAVRQNRTARDLVIAGAVLLLLFLILLFNRYRIKQKANTLLQARQKEINEKNTFLQHVVDEKEWLLKEVHHRVKNNLHTVICLLESQAEYLQNDALRAVEVIQQRIYAMSLIHQKLYQSEDVKAIDMSAYVPEFIQYLDESFGANSHIAFKLDIAPLKIGLAQAIPIALIINETATNAIKHAFPGDSRGVVFISMQQTGDWIELIIADNGIGLDPASMNTRSDTLGLKLIRGLSEDINASVRITAEQGTRIAILFKLDPSAKDAFRSSDMTEKNYLYEHEDTYSGGSVY